MNKRPHKVLAYLVRLAPILISVGHSADAQGNGQNHPLRSELGISVPEPMKKPPQGSVSKWGNGYAYVINVDENLGFIASRLYGTVKYVRKIVVWNNITNPNRIQVGQLLILKEKPKFLKDEDQRIALLKQLAIKFQLGEDWVEKSLQTLRQTQKGRHKKLDAGAASIRHLSAIPVLDPEASNDSQATSNAQLLHSRKLDPEQAALLAATEFKTTDELSKAGAQLYASHEFFSALILLRAARKKDTGHFQSWLQELIIRKRCMPPEDLTYALKELKQSKLNEAAQEQIRTLVQKQGDSACPSKDKKPEIDNMNIEFVLSAGEALAAENRCKEALLFITRARRELPEEVKPWILEINCLKKEKRKAEARRVVQAFKEIHPALSNLPFLRVDEGF